MKKLFAIAGLVATAYLPVTHAQEFQHVHAETHNNVACVKTNEEEIKALFDRWNAALATLNPDDVTEEYASDAILLPTLSDIPRTTHEEIREYFVHFLEKKPQGKINMRVIKLGCNTASDTGLYTFTIHDKNGKTKEVEARYSFVYEYDDDQWLIEHHHSSLMPEQLTIAANASKKHHGAKHHATHSHHHA
ncbi:MAG TPA: hypothetical protein DF614_08195 [Methylococcaceae bacterium]|nr:hypothetical protein [Methylococcaceae bacterium]